MAGGTVAEYPDNVKRRAAWLNAHEGGEITCRGGVFTATLDGTAVAEKCDLGRLMDRLDYLAGARAAR